MSIVNHSNKFIFLHIPKCGGTFVTSFLAQYTRYCDQEVGATKFGEKLQPLYEQRFGLRKHSTAQELFSIVGPAVWRAYLVFSVVRNPFSRAVSTYTFLKHWREWPGSEIMDQFQNVNDFIDSAYWQSSGVDQILMAQADFLAVSGPEALPVDKVWPLETLDLQDLGQSLGVTVDPSTTTRPKRSQNASPKGPTEAVLLNERSVHKIVERYRKDFDLGGYPVEPPSLVQSSL